MPDDQTALFDVIEPPRSEPLPRVSDDDPAPPPPPVPDMDTIREQFTSPIGRHPLLPDPVDGPRGGEAYDETLDRGRLRGQQAAVQAAMSDHEWHTLAWLAAEVGATQPSVSARLRDMRKPAYGSRVIDRRRVPGGNGLHEYRLDPDKRAPLPSPDRTLRHAVRIMAEPLTVSPYAIVVLTCCHCQWRYELTEGSTVQDAQDALARHPREDSTA